MSTEIVELDRDVSGSPYWNHDMAPVTAAGRHWGMRDMAVLWVSMAACITTYTLSSSLIAMGMNWWQAVGTILIANVIVLLPMILNAHAGTRYGIPFPVYCRASFGIRGANVPAVLRALVACGWFGIQTWIGGDAIYKIVEMNDSSWTEAPQLAIGINAAELACFLAFWLINMIVIFRGIETIRFLLNIKAPLLIILGLVLLRWAYVKADGWGPMFSTPSQFDAGQPKAGQFWLFFFPALTANIGYWATLSLNIPDFSRYARSQRDQVFGQAIGLPATMALYAFIGVAVTSATVAIFGSAIWDPVKLLPKFDSPGVRVLAAIALCLATLATNIAANVVSPANDFAHLWPRRIGFRTGGLITGLIGIAIMPWHLYRDPNGYIFKWLIAYGSLLGAIGGVLIADYYVVRKMRLKLADMYLRDGDYWYGNGFNNVALIALVAGIIPCVPGFVGNVKLMDVGEFWMELYHYAWFISFGIAFSVYALLQRRVERASRRDARSTDAF